MQVIANFFMRPMFVRNAFFSCIFPLFIPLIGAFDGSIFHLLKTTTCGIMLVQFTTGEGNQDVPRKPMVCSVPNKFDKRVSF